MERALSATAGTPTTWLEHLVQRKQVAEEQVAALAARESFLPLCELDRLEKVPAEVIALVPWDLAIEHRVIPIGVEPEGDVRLAMLDPFNEVTLTELAFFLGRRILREVAPATPMAWALHRYYGFRSALWPQQVRPTLRSQPAIRAVQVAL